MTDASTATGNEPAIIIEKATALAVLTNEEQFDAFERRIREEVEKHVPDLTTSAGRKAIAALAFKVTKTKTAIVAAADILTEDARKQVAAVRDSKKRIEERLNALQVEARKPLTDWEAEQERREEHAKTTLAGLRAAAIVQIDETADQLRSRLHALSLISPDSAELGDHFDIALSLHRSATEALENGIARAAQAEADAAELTAMRAERAAREAREAAEREEREAAEALERHNEMLRENQRRERERLDQEERDRVEAERVAEESRQEAIRVAAEQAAESARAQAEQEAEEARQAEQRRRDEEQAERDRVAAEELAEANRLREASEAEALRLRQENEAAEAERQREADAAAARLKDRAHKASVMGEAKEAIKTVLGPMIGMGDGLTPAAVSEFAVALVRAIVADEIPHTKIEF